MEVNYFRLLKKDNLFSIIQFLSRDDKINLSLVDKRTHEICAKLLQMHPPTHFYFPHKVPQYKENKRFIRENFFYKGYVPRSGHLGPKGPEGFLLFRQLMQRSAVNLLAPWEELNIKFLGTEGAEYKIGEGRSPLGSCVNFGGCIAWQSSEQKGTLNVLDTLYGAFRELTPTMEMNWGSCLCVRQEGFGSEYSYVIDQLSDSRNWPSCGLINFSTCSSHPLPNGFGQVAGLASFRSHGKNYLVLAEGKCCYNEGEEGLEIHLWLCNDSAQKESERFVKITESIGEFEKESKLNLEILFLTPGKVDLRVSGQSLEIGGSLSAYVYDLLGPSRRVMIDGHARPIFIGAQLLFLHPRVTGRTFCFDLITQEKKKLYSINSAGLPEKYSLFTAPWDQASYLLGVRPGLTGFLVLLITGSAGNQRASLFAAQPTETGAVEGGWYWDYELKRRIPIVVYEDQQRGLRLWSAKKASITTCIAHLEPGESWQLISGPAPRLIRGRSGHPIRLFTPSPEDRQVPREAVASVYQLPTINCQRGAWTISQQQLLCAAAFVGVGILLWRIRARRSQMGFGGQSNFCNGVFFANRKSSLSF